MRRVDYCASNLFINKSLHSHLHLWLITKSCVSKLFSTVSLRIEIGHASE